MLFFPTVFPTMDSLHNEHVPQTARPRAGCSYIAI